MDIRILLADDHQITREGLRSLLEAEPGLTVVGEAEDGRSAVDLARKLHPDVVLMDIGMPDLNGIEATRQVRAECPRAKVIALSMHSDKRFVARMLEAGAAGYAVKNTPFKELAQGIRDVAHNRIFLSPGIVGVVVDNYVQRLPVEQVTAAPVLTGRERKVLQLIAEGHSTKAIAAELSVSIKTIETHRRKIMIKLNAHSVAELTKFAVREGLTALEE